MKYLYVILFLFVGITCCACGIHSAGNGSSGAADSESTISDEMVQLPPQTAYTLEELTDQTAGLRDFVVDSYQKMQDLAASDDAKEAGKEKAETVENEYSERIAELAGTDFSQMTEEELTQYLIELTNLTAIIREANDALTFG